MLSVVLPAYNEEKMIQKAAGTIGGILQKEAIDYEIIFVDDGSKDGTWQQIEQTQKEDQHVNGVRFSRNFGKESAMMAGLENAGGDCVVVMDCDLQDRPEAIVELYQKAQEGYDVVFARRTERVDTAVTKFLSKTFYKVYDYFTDGAFDSSICNFSISKRKVINSYCSMREHNRAFTMFIRWLGFKETAIDLKADARFEGTSSYNLKRKLKMAFEIITSQSNKPLFFSVHAGFLIALCSFLYIVYLMLRALVIGDILSGWTTIVASIYLMGGLLLIAIGVVGIYIGNIFEEVKNRPLYVIAEALNEKE